MVTENKSDILTRLWCLQPLWCLPQEDCAPQLLKQEEEPSLSGGWTWKHLRRDSLCPCNPHSPQEMIPPLAFPFYHLPGHRVTRALPTHSTLATEAPDHPRLSAPSQTQTGKGGPQPRLSSLAPTPPTASSFLGKRDILSSRREGSV